MKYKSREEIKLSEDDRNFKLGYWRGIDDQQQEVLDDIFHSPNPVFLSHDELVEIRKRKSGLPYIPASRTASIPNQKAITKRLPDEAKPQDKFYHNALKSQLSLKSHDSSVERRSKLSAEKSRESIHDPRHSPPPTFTRKGTMQIQYINPGPQRNHEHGSVSLEPQHTGYSFGQALRDSPTKRDPSKVSSIFGDIMVKF
jgi:hypothetical protein